MRVWLPGRAAAVKRAARATDAAGIENPRGGTPMFRWGCLLLGLVLLYQSTVDWIGAEPVAPAREVTLAEAHAWAARGETPEGLVRFQAALDRDRRLHRSGLARPHYTGCAPFEVHALAGDGLDDPVDLAGCWVSFRAPLDPRTLTMQLVEERRDADGTVRTVKNQKFLSPVSGSGLRLWVLSPVVFGGDEQKGLEWMARVEHRGKLARLADLDANRPDLGHSVAEIRSFFLRHNGEQVPGDAWVVLADAGAPPPDSVIERSRWLMPLVGGEGALFVEVGLDQEARHDGVVTGSLRPLSEEDVADLARLLDSEVAARAAFVELETAEALNRRESSLHHMAFALSFALVGTGGGLVVLRRWRVARARRAHEQAFDAEMLRQNASQAVRAAPAPQPSAPPRGAPPSSGGLSGFRVPDEE